MDQSQRTDGGRKPSFTAENAETVAVYASNMLPICTNHHHRFSSGRRTRCFRSLPENVHPMAPNAMATAPNYEPEERDLDRSVDHQSRRG